NRDNDFKTQTLDGPNWLSGVSSFRETVASNCSWSLPPRVNPIKLSWAWALETNIAMTNDVPNNDLNIDSSTKNLQSTFNSDLVQLVGCGNCLRPGTRALAIAGILLNHAA